jgi:CRP-like cAMP-binding protein
VRSYPRGSVLFHEEQSSDHVVVLLRGAVKVTVCDEEGRESLLAIHGPGDLIGELGAIESEPRFGTATALEPVEALVVPATVFREIVAARPAAAEMVMHVLGNRLRDSGRKRAEFGTRAAGARIAARLLELADRFGVRVEEGIRIELPLTQDEIAMWTGCSREAVTKAMHTMRESQWLKTGRRSILILDEQALRDWSLSG